ncbi:hypothetical protein ACFPPA_00205 [Rhodanobacter ginsengisoli]|uniref:Antibiotic biosynthesis monooxygenase n=1 Tax=Rhodanobacter ginsengisoli TaxID=418646 RepID=A0ABW0QN88_9GAMM
MKQVLVTYATKPECAEENARLVGEVFAELHARAPRGLHYVVLRRGDGTFMHFVQQDDGATGLSDLESFRAFQQAVSERWRERPVVADVEVVGSYGMAPKTD